MSTLRAVAARHGPPTLRRLPAAWTGHRWLRREPLRAHVARMRAAGAPVELEVVHPVSIARNPLPEGVADVAALPADRGWWGFSFRDVPTRRNGETVVARLRGCVVVTASGGLGGHEFLPAILSADGRSIDLREVHWRPEHRRALHGAPAVEVDRATWILERVYDNHAHWLTGHLPKLLLLRARGELGDVVLPARRSPAIDASLRMLGIDPDDHLAHETGRPLRVRALTVLNTDRFRPELLGLVRDAFAPARAGAEGGAPGHRLFISRAAALRRRLRNEEQVWAVLRHHGFQRVALEDLTFPDQVQLLRGAATVVAPHGAGLANLVFCRPGTKVVEIADLRVPSPNFYAMSAGLGLRYWVVDATGTGNRGWQSGDLDVDPVRLDRVVAAAVDA